MSDFFSGIQNARFPDLVMNQGPLPPTDGLPAPLHDTADARINASTSLLGNLTPYAYGEPGYQSSQVSYVNHPHRIQKIFPELRLPRGILYAQDDFTVSHPVDDSDVAFVMRLNRCSTSCKLLKNTCITRYNLGTAIDPFINLATVNYLLAGFQLCTGDLSRGETNLWKTLLHDLSQDHFNTQGFQERNRITLEDIFYISRELISPFGVVRGSEKQGGQHEMGLSPVSWPVNFVGTLVIDGKERNVLNYWHNKDVAAGDDLCFRLKAMPIPENGYTLNHYYKGISRQDFKSLDRNPLAGNKVTHVWQLVPDIFELASPSENLSNMHFANPSLEPPAGKPYRWQEWGFWHIGRTQVHANKCSVSGDYYNDDMAMNLRLGHLEMTFAPCWQKVPGRPFLQRAIEQARTDGTHEYTPSSGLKSVFSETLFMNDLFQNQKHDDDYGVADWSWAKDPEPLSTIFESSSPVIAPPITVPVVQPPLQHEAEAIKSIVKKRVSETPASTTAPPAKQMKKVVIKSAI